jgi:hypothetical protein
MVTINGVDCYGEFDVEECFSVAYNLPNGEGVEDYVDVDESVATNFTQLVKYLEKILPDCEILEIECG